MIEVWLPNENKSYTMHFDHALFKVNSIYDDLVYGWYKESYVNIKREDYDNLQETEEEELFKILTQAH